MNDRIDVIEMLRRANPVAPGSIDDSDVPTAGELRALMRAVPTTVPTVSLDEPATHVQRRWPKYFAAAAAVAAGLAAIILVPRNQEDPADPAATTASVPSPAPGPFVGVWLSTDIDGSSQIMEILASVTAEYEIVVRDDDAGVCSGASSTMVGTGRLQADEVLVVAQPVYTCDDGSIPQADSGLPLHEQLANLTFVHDSATDQLLDSLGLGWRRKGAEDAGDAGASGTTATPSPSAELEPDLGTPTASQQAVIGQLVDAVNTAAADDVRDEASLPDVFTEDAMFSPFDEWAGRLLTEPGLLRTWFLHLQAWGFEGEVQERECWTEDSEVICPVRARWHTVLAEADEYWRLHFVGDRIRALNIQGPGTRLGDKVLPLSLAELDQWEDWLRQTDPNTAATLLPADVTSRRPFPVVPRYDPALADQVTASIQLYLTQRGPGDEITVTADLVGFGDGLVGLIGNMTRADGLTYVIGGRYETEMDLLTAPEEAVLAAFDDAGTELWRTELDGTPVAVVTVGGDVWVSHSAGRLSRIDASNGRVVDRMNVGNVSAMVGAFGSLWVQIGDSAGPLQLIRIDPDLTTTTVELPPHDLVDGDDCCLQGPTAGGGVMWEPLREHGVAMIDPDTLEVTVIPGDEIGHDVIQVAVDGDVAYVASGNQVTSIVDGEVRATTSIGDIGYLGPVEGVFGAMIDGGFVVLEADAPVQVEVRQVSIGPGATIDGEAWTETGRNYNLQRVQFLPVPGTNGG